MSGEKKREKKTYYCPFDLQPINMDNLAYELAFNESFSYKTAKDDDKFKELTTVDGDSLIELSTERRAKVFGFEEENKNGDKEEPCPIVVENGDSEGESAVSGLSFLIENVELNSKAGIKDVPMKNKSAGKYDLVEAKVNIDGNYEFFNRYRQRVMTDSAMLSSLPYETAEGMGRSRGFLHCLPDRACPNW